MTEKNRKEKETASTEKTSGQSPTEEVLRDALTHVVDPELHMNIIDLGLVYETRMNGNVAEVEMTLTSPGCPYGPYLLHLVNRALLAVDGVEDSRVEVVWDPPWSPEKMSEEARLELGFDV